MKTLKTLSTNALCMGYLVQDVTFFFSWVEEKWDLWKKPDMAVSPGIVRSFHTGAFAECFAFLLRAFSGE